VINNFQKFQNILDFQSEDDFYLLQIMKRRKDNPEMDKGTKIIDEVYIDNLEFYQRKQEDWIKLANEQNARVTIKLNKRSYRKCAFKSLVDITKKIELGQFRACRHSFKNMAGKHKAPGSKFWIVDIDNVEKGFDIDNFVANLSVPQLPLRDVAVSILPSRTGYHIISKPFDLKKFNDWYRPPTNPKATKIEIIKDGCTNLYIP